MYLNLNIRGVAGGISNKINHESFFRGFTNSALSEGLSPIINRQPNGLRKIVAGTIIGGVSAGISSDKDLGEGLFDGFKDTVLDVSWEKMTHNQVLNTIKDEIIISKFDPEFGTTETYYRSYESHNGKVKIIIDHQIYINNHRTHSIHPTIDDKYNLRLVPGA